MRWALLVFAVACGGSSKDEEDSGDTSATDGGTGGTDTSPTGSTTEPAGPGSPAIAFVPYDVTTSNNALPTVKLYPLGDGADLPETPAELEVAPGFFLTAGLSSLEAPLFQPEATWISAVSVPPADQLPVQLNGTVLDYWYMAPFDYHSTEPLAVRLTNTYGVEADADLELWVGSYEQSAWTKAGDLTVEGGDLVLDGGLYLISTVVLLDAGGQSNPPPPAEPGAVTELLGNVTGLDGAPLADARVQYCRGENCLTYRSEADGAFSFPDLATGPGSFEVIP